MYINNIINEMAYYDLRTKREIVENIRLKHLKHSVFKIGDEGEIRRFDFKCPETTCGCYRMGGLIIRGNVLPYSEKHKNI